MSIHLGNSLAGWVQLIWTDFRDVSRALFLNKKKSPAGFKNHQENKALAVLQKQKGVFRPAQSHPFISQP